MMSQSEWEVSLRYRLIRSAWPIGGEHWGHVTSSPPITAHLVWPAGAEAELLEDDESAADGGDEPGHGAVHCRVEV